MPTTTACATRGQKAPPLLVPLTICGATVFSGEVF